MSYDGDSSFQNSAKLIALGTLSSRILGFVRDLLMASLFDRFLTDCFIVAFRLPNFFRRLMGEGALAASLIPQLTTTFIEHKPTPQSRQYLNSVWTLWLVILSTLTAAGVIWTPEIIRYLVGGEGFLSVAGKLQLAQSMARVMFPFIWFISVAAFASALLHSQNRFFAAAFAPVALNTAVILSLFLGAQWISWAVLIGGALHVLFLWPQLGPLRPQLSLRVQLVDLQRFASAFAPNALSTGALQIIGLLNLYFASRLAQGSHSYLYWVDRLLEFPMSLVGVSLGSALLPRLSHAFFEKRSDDFQKLLTSALRTALFWSLPFVVGMIFLAQPVIQLLFERGQFTTHDTATTAELLQIASLTLLAGTLMRTVQPVLYAIHRPQVAAWLSVATVAIHGAVGFFATDALGLPGLAWSVALSTTAHLILTLSYLGHIPLLLKQWRFVVATLPMMGVALTYPWLVATLTFPAAISHVIALIVSAGLGFFGYLLSCQLMGVSEFAMIKISREEKP